MSTLKPQNNGCNKVRAAGCFGKSRQVVFDKDDTALNQNFIKIITECELHHLVFRLNILTTVF